MLFEGGHKPAGGLGNEEGRQGRKMAAHGDGKRETFKLLPSASAPFISGGPGRPLLVDLVGE